MVGDSQAGEARLGKIVLFGSGETSASGRPIHDRLLAELQPPITIAILETPAGFQPNSERVAGQVAEFFRARLRNYHPQVHLIAARKKGTSFSPDDPRILEPLLDASYIFMGPGSPTYAVRILEGTLALQYMLARHQEGAVLCFASAAAIAVGAKALPVYEIFKAGSDLYWAQGLDIFGLFGLELAIVTHWNNREGGAYLDTSCCFMGRERMGQLKELLSPSTVVLGIDEHTALVLDLQRGQGLVMGKGTVTIQRKSGEDKIYPAGDAFPIGELGPYRPRPVSTFSLPGRRLGEGLPSAGLSSEVIHLIGLREEARRARDWLRADAIRRQLADMGFEIRDTREGPRWRYKGEQGDGRPVPRPLGQD